MLSTINEFLSCATPASWLNLAVQNIELLLIDHAHCEKKAASTALSLMYRYVEYPTLLQTLSRLAREELRHFEQVLQLLQQRNIAYIHLESAFYAKGLRQHCRTYEPGRLLDLLLISAIIEARSCERFAALSEFLPQDLAGFYRALVKAEARHYTVYLQHAQMIAKQQHLEQDLAIRQAFFLQLESKLILQTEAEFRLHSGVPPSYSF